MSRRLTNLIRMNNIVKHMNNEDAYASWIVLIPDEATEQDLAEIAEDVDDYDDAVNLFVWLVDTYGSDGILPTEK